jgi:hypothetical protein
MLAGKSSTTAEEKTGWFFFGIFGGSCEQCSSKPCWLMLVDD